MNFLVRLTGSLSPPTPVAPEASEASESMENPEIPSPQDLHQLLGSHKASQYALDLLKLSNQNLTSEGFNEVVAPKDISQNILEETFEIVKTYPIPASEVQQFIRSHVLAQCQLSIQNLLQFMTDFDGSSPIASGDPEAEEIAREAKLTKANYSLAKIQMESASRALETARMTAQTRQLEEEALRISQGAPSPVQNPNPPESMGPTGPSTLPGCYLSGFYPVQQCWAYVMDPMAANQSNSDQADREQSPEESESSGESTRPVSKRRREE